MRFQITRVSPLPQRSRMNIWPVDSSTHARMRLDFPELLAGAAPADMTADAHTPVVRITAQPAATPIRIAVVMAFLPRRSPAS